MLLFASPLSRSKIGVHVLSLPHIKSYILDKKNSLDNANNFVCEFISKSNSSITAIWRVALNNWKRDHFKILKLNSFMTGQNSVQSKFNSYPVSINFATFGE